MIDFKCFIEGFLNDRHIFKIVESNVMLFYN